MLYCHFYTSNMHQLPIPFFVLFAFWTLCLPVKATDNIIQANLTMAAFNVQIFGRSKAEKADVMEALKNIFRKFDMILMQEIRDSSGTAVIELLNDINSGLSEADKYKVLLSDRFGSSSIKEQYGWFYRPTRLNPVYNYAWTSRSSFERYPQAVWWNAQNKPSNLTFVTVGAFLTYDACLFPHHPATSHKPKPRTACRSRRSHS